MSVKCKVLSAAHSKLLSAVVVNIANPALILSAVTGGKKGIQGKDLLITVMLAIIIYAVLIVCGNLITMFLKVEKQDKGCYKLMTVFSNIGFMGFPLITALYGNEALLYAAVFQMAFNILIYTYGIQVMGSKINGKIQWKRLLNIGVITCSITMVLYITQIKLPVVITSTITYLSGLTAPLSMMVIGISFANMDFKEVIKDVRLWLFALIKLLVIPIMGCMVLKQFIVNEQLRGVCMIILATPVASLTAMLAQQYDCGEELASKGVAFTTLLSVLTLPIVSLLVG